MDLERAKAADLPVGTQVANREAGIEWTRVNPGTVFSWRSAQGLVYDDIDIDTSLTAGAVVLRLGRKAT